MIVIMQLHAGSGPTDIVVRRIEGAGFGAHVFKGAERDVIAVLGAGEPESLRDALLAVSGVERVEATTRAFKLASRDVLPAGTTFTIGCAEVGGSLLVVIGTARAQPAGRLVALAQAARQAGAELFWVGRGDDGELRHDLVAALGEIRSTVGLPVLVDVWDPGEIDRMSRHADALQIPSHQMQDIPLVRAAGQGDRPVFIARGPAATIEEWLLAGERVLQEGNRKVALVEQGVRTFETAVRAMLDLNAVAVARRLSHLPVLVNPSLAAGQAEIVADLALAATATGCEGVLIDADTPDVDGAVSHRQALSVDLVTQLVPRLKRTRAAIVG
ncbi:MAG TPA: N-acetylneuraminate synthase family protein [Chloroflexota bacterium]|nr:N-acetylneuraminate synthase family protein [Chloroflexota bacterium]